MEELHRRNPTGFLIRLWYCLVMLSGMLKSWCRKPRFSGLEYLSYIFYILRRNGLAKKYNTERYITSNTENFQAYLQQMINSDNSTQTKKFKFTVYEYIIVYGYIILLSYYLIWYIYIYIYKYFGCLTFRTLCKATEIFVRI